MNKNKDAIFKALSDLTRRQILDELSERNEMTLFELTSRLIVKHNLTISRQGVSKHLSVLEDAMLVKSKRKGKYRAHTYNNEQQYNYKGERNIMKVIVNSIFVEDQSKALEFYAEKLGFVKKHDEPAGEFRWITVVSPDDQNGTELLLEPNEHPASKEYQQKI